MPGFVVVVDASLVVALEGGLVVADLDFGKREAVDWLRIEIGVEHTHSVVHYLEERRGSKVVVVSFLEGVDPCWTVDLVAVSIVVVQAMVHICSLELVREAVDCMGMDLLGSLAEVVHDIVVARARSPLEEHMYSQQKKVWEVAGGRIEEGQPSMASSCEVELVPWVVGEVE
jgi:hypothetical protein